MNFNITTFAQHGNTAAPSEGVLTDTLLSYAINKPTIKRLSSACMVGLALSGTMGTANFIEYQVSRRSTTNTYDVNSGSDFKTSTRRKLGQSWFASEISHSIQSNFSVESLDALQVAIHDAYGDVRVEASIHTDPEEGWTKPVFKVHSGIEDFDVLMDVEDRFFDKAENNPILRRILPLVIISQA